MKKNINILITGLGGQGVITFSKILANTFTKKGFMVKTTETIGMAQRGGSVSSYIRIGDTCSPLFNEKDADIKIDFEQNNSRGYNMILLGKVYTKYFKDYFSKDDVISSIKEMTNKKSLTKNLSGFNEGLS